MTKEEIGELVRRYQAGESSIQLAKAFGCSKPTALKHIRRAGVRRRSTSEAMRRDRFNEAAFDSINEESAYWVGLLMADGCVHHSRGGRGTACITLALHSDDVSHVERFKAFLNTSAKIYKYRNKSMATVTVTSRRLAEALALYGVTPRKSLTAKVSGLQCNKDFWRGVLDGDGYIAPHAARGKYVGLCGSPALMAQFAAFVNSVSTGVRPITVAEKRGNLHVVSLYGSRATQVLRVLYSGCLVALPRKREKADLVVTRQREAERARARRCPPVNGAPNCR